MPGALKVAMTTSRYLPRIGGTETHVHEVAGRMKARGFDVTVLTVDAAPGPPPSKPGEPFRVLRFRAWPASGDLQVPRGLLHELTTGCYDLVHVQGVHTLLAPLTLAFSLRARLPTVVTFHTGGHVSRIRTASRGWQWRSMGRMLRRADALIAVCGYEVQLFSRLLGVDASSIHLIGNGADPLPVAAGPPGITGKPLVVSVGRLERYKGHDRLITALPALRTLYPEVRLAIVGRGTYEMKLRELASRLGVRSSVTFAAYDSDHRELLGSLVASSDVFALLSEYEAHPVAVLEALGLGRKVLVADTSGLSELARHDLVTLVDRSTEPAALARVIARVVSSSSRPPPQLPTWSDCADSVARVYREVLRTGSSG